MIYGISRLKLFLGGSLFALCFQVQAEDLLGVLAQAKERDAKFLAAKYQFEATGEAKIQARADLLPTFSYQIERRQTDQDIVKAQNAVFNNTSSSYDTDTQGFVLTQTLFDYSRFQRYSQSKITISRGEAEFEAARQDLLMRVAEGYFLVLERQDQLATVQDEKAAMDKHLSVAERKAARGLSRTVDVDDARARYLNALSKEIELQSYLMDARYSLRQITGEMPDELLPLKEVITLEKPQPDDPQAWLEVAIAKNPLLKASEFAVREASKEVTLLKGGHYPTLELMYNSTNRDAGGSLFDGSSETDTAEVVLQLNIPIYAGGGVSSKVRAAEMAKRKAQEEQEMRKREVERATVDAWRRIGAAIAQIEALAQSVAAQEKMLEIKDRGYSAGRFHILEVLDAQQDLSSARQALTKARYDYALNTLRLKHSSGSLQDQDLAVVDGWLEGKMPAAAAPAAALPISSNIAEHPDTPAPQEATPQETQPATPTTKVGVRNRHR